MKARPAGHAAAIASRPVDEDVTRLLRELTARVCATSAPDPLAHHLLLDIRVDGIRCTLVREHSPVLPGASPCLLSPREREIASMVAEGCSNKAVAASLGISAWTVAAHLRRIFAKLGVRSRAAMVARVLDQRP
jgi:DNA-binding CsgD family transcriptional regulator